MLEINNLSFYYNDRKIINNFSMKLNEGECLAICGPSGCGKSTLLRIIAGLEQPQSGKIIKKGIDITNLDCNKRKIAILFQDYLLFPHMTCLQNVEYASKHTALKYLTLVQMEKYVDYYPHQLSGGQQQRVALARVLCSNPDIILLDEPFSNYDTNLKKKIRQEIKDILQEQNKTIVLVTHDQEDSKVLANKTICMLPSSW